MPKKSRRKKGKKAPITTCMLYHTKKIKKEKQISPSRSIKQKKKKKK